MDHPPVSASGHNPAGWQLAYPHARDTQGLVVSGYSASPVARALLLRFEWSAGTKGRGAWLEALAGVAPITNADGRDERCAAIAFTWLGLREMGLDANSLESFDRPFKEGMFQEDRLRRLGDRRGDAWLPTVIESGPRWSGNTPPDAAVSAPRAGAFRVDDGRPPLTAIAAPITVHALLLLYEKDEPRADAWAAQVEAAIAPLGVTVAHRLPLSLRLDPNGIGREHFGFADGISQPVPFAAGVVKTDSGGDAPEGDSIHRVPLGEVLMGHLNAHGEVALGPVVPDSARGRSAGLRPHPRGEGFLDLGLDGSFMVVRELHQDVARFWRAMDQAAATISQTAPAEAQVDGGWIADRVVGRDRDGNVLCPGGVLPPGAPGQPDNEFLYFDGDLLGFGCPRGSHVRRGNPRDGLAPTSGDRATLLAAANSHRILRRGRKFGPDIADPRVDDGAERGLLFICLNTDIGRQFEFVQQTWVLNQNFALLFDEVDPLIGPTGPFTIPDQRLRRIVEVPTFVQMAGGEYFFLPSLPALRYLEGL